MRIKRLGMLSLMACVLGVGGCSATPKAGANDSEAERRMKETASDSAESRQPFGPNSPGTNTLGTGENAVPFRKPGEPIDAPRPGQPPKGVSAPKADDKGDNTSAEEVQRGDKSPEQNEATE